MLGEFVIACGDSTEVLDAAEVRFNEIAVLIVMLKIESRCVAVGSGRNYCLGPALSNRLAQMIRIKGLIGNNRLGIYPRAACSPG